VDALSEVFRMLDERGSTARARELRAEARFYERAIRRWETVPPSSAQIDAMFDLVTELHGKTKPRSKRGPREGGD
jgi:hypothetical protein